MRSPSDYDDEMESRTDKYHCTHDCMVANKCFGHVRCAVCGDIVCGCEVENGICLYCQVIAEEDAK